MAGEVLVALARLETLEVLLVAVFVVVVVAAAAVFEAAGGVSFFKDKITLDELDDFTDGSHTFVLSFCLVLGEAFALAPCFPFFFLSFFVLLSTGLDFSVAVSLAAV